MTAPGTLAALDDAIGRCRRCPRLVAWREEVAVVKRASFSDEEYWGRAVPGFGSATPSIWVVGLAPAAHGANRTGRMFTGDRSGDWLFGSLHRVGLATLPTSTSRDDGQSVAGVRVTAAVHCAPPDNKPTPEEFAACADWLDDERALIEPTVAVVVALGGLAWAAVLRCLAAGGWSIPRPRPRFGHGSAFAAVTPEGRTGTVLGSYHPSQQNTFTGRLTEPMLDAVLMQARQVAGL